MALSEDLLYKRVRRMSSKSSWLQGASFLVWVGLGPAVVIAFVVGTYNNFVGPREELNGHNLVWGRESRSRVGQMADSDSEPKSRGLRLWLWLYKHPKTFALAFILGLILTVYLVLLLSSSCNYYCFYPGP
jgi:hypothetical protein